MAKSNSRESTDQPAVEYDEEHSQIFQFSVEHAPDAVFWLDRDARIYHANIAACKSLGYTREELTKLNLWDIDPVHQRETWDATWAATSKSDPVRVRTFETLHRRKDGTIFPVEVSSNQLRIGDAEFHVSFVRNIAERKKTEELLNLTQSAIDLASSSCAWIRNDGMFVYVNLQQCKSLGYSSQELLEMHVHDIDPDYQSAVWEQFWQRLRETKVVTFETIHRRKDGHQFPVEITANYLEYSGKAYCCTFERDLTDVKQSEEVKRSLEAQLHQAQKMESIGRLAGGVAHDFNNMLSVILGYVDMIKNRLPPTEEWLDELVQIEKAALRSSHLTRQLLAFSRQQAASPSIINLNHSLEELKKTLGRLIGEDVGVELVPGAGLWDVKMDSTQVDQVIVNLAVNARDAMPNGGTLRIESDNINIDAGYCSEHCEFIPGQYVRLTVSDTGCGMDKKIMSNIFDPFFTTKEIGKGTGLGLAVVYGIIKQNGGYIYPYSEVGLGTTMKVYIPRSTGDCPIVIGEDSPQTMKGTETILVVEDEDLVRTMTESMLRQLGYKVLAVDNPTEALAILEMPGGRVDLLLTDVVMPGMNGPELRRRALTVCPDLKVLCMSGYSTEITAHQNRIHPGLPFIQKPFSMLDLSIKVRAALAGPITLLMLSALP